jgi:hypothetical protein
MPSELTSRRRNALLSTSMFAGRPGRRTDMIGMMAGAPSTNGDPATDRLPIHIQSAYAGILRGNDLPPHFADAL